MIVRYLDAQKDKDVLRTAWRWTNAAPRWFQDCFHAWKESEDEYLESAKKELNYGVFENGEPQAVVRLIEAYPWVLCIHLMARPKTPFEMLVKSGLVLRDYLFKHGIKGFYAYVPARNKAVVRLFESLEFADTGIRCFKGVTHGRVIEWRHFAIGQKSDCELMAN